MKHCRRLAVMLLASSLCACGPSSTLEDLQYATLTPYEGLGELRLGVTTMQEFLSRYGHGAVAGIFGDETAVEFGFGQEGIAVLFMIEGECKQQTFRLSARELTLGLREHVDFFSRFPACSTATLESIDITGGRKPNTPYWQGATSEGVALNNLVDRVRSAYGEPLVNSAGGILAGSSGAVNARYEVMGYSNHGIVVWLLEASSGPDAGRLVVQRLSIYRRSES